MEEKDTVKSGYHNAMAKGTTQPDIAMPPLDEVEAAPVETVAEEVETQVSPTPEAVAEDAPAEQEAPAKPLSNNQENIRLLREKAKSADRFQQERDELLSQIKEMSNKGNPKAPETQQVEEDDDFNVQPDDLVEGKHLKKIANKYKKLEQQLKNYQKQSQETSIESRLKNEYPDFDKVVSKENVEELKTLYPHLAATLHASPDLYNKGASAYTLIKRLGINREDTYSDDRNRAITNSAKPRPLASVSPQQGDSPLSHANAFANGLTDDLKRQLQKEMSEAIKHR